MAKKQLEEAVKKENTDPKGKIEEGNSISIIFDQDAIVRGGIGIEDIPVEEFTSKVKEFLEKVSKAFSFDIAPAEGIQMTEFTLNANIGMGGKLSLLGSGIETKAGAGISFKFKVVNSGEDTPDA
jgi:hypothetical protein